MKAYLCSIGEKTTDICKEQLERFGFEVIMLDEKEAWTTKYRKFLARAEEDCIRIDADIIPNKMVEIIARELSAENHYLMAQFYGFDFYKNNFGVMGIAYYSKKGLEIIKKNLDKIDWRRPEATAWRIPEINEHTFSYTDYSGMHGFGQTWLDLERHKQHKIDRKQIQDYDFDLAKKLLNL